MSAAELEVLEANIKRQQKFVDMGESLERLYMNRDFRKVITEGYLEQEAIRLVHLKADPNMQSVESQKSIVQQIDSIGSLSAFFHLIRYQAEMAGKTIAFDEQTREDLLAEGR